MDLHLLWIHLKKLQMEIEPLFCEKHIIHRKKQFDQNVHNETARSTKESFRIDYSYIIVDKAISWIENSSQYHNHA